MDKQVEQKAFDIASKLRPWLVKHAKKVKGYDFDPKDLGCMCAYATILLQRHLHTQGIFDFHIASNQYHVFLYNKKTKQVLDVTATQFSFKHDEKVPEVVFCKLKDLLKKEKNLHTSTSWWKVSKLYSTSDHAYEALKPTSKNGFPFSQIWATSKKMNSTFKSSLKAFL